MIVIIMTALWQLRSVHEMISYLVADKMVKQQIASSLLNAVNLSSAHALSSSKSDSLELADYFEAKRLKGELVIDKLRERLIKTKSDGVEASLIENLDAKRQKYAAVLQKISAFKELGQTQEVGQALEGGCSGADAVHRQHAGHAQLSRQAGPGGNAECRTNL